MMSLSVGQAIVVDVDHYCYWFIVFEKKKTLLFCTCDRSFTLQVSNYKNSLKLILNNKLVLWICVSTSDWLRHEVVLKLQFISNKKEEHNLDKNWNEIMDHYRYKKESIIILYYTIWHKIAYLKMNTLRNFSKYLKNFKEFIYFLNHCQNWVF